MYLLSFSFKPWVSLCLFLLEKIVVYNCLAFSTKLQPHHPFGLIKTKLLKSLFNSFFPCLISEGRWITCCSYCAVKIAEKIQSLCKNCGCIATLLTSENKKCMFAFMQLGMFTESLNSGQRAYKTFITL